MSLPFYFGLDISERAVVQGGGGLVEPGHGAAGGDVQRLGFLARGVARPAATRRSRWRCPSRSGLAAIYFRASIEVAAHRGPGYCDSLTGLIFFLLCGRLFQKKTYDRLTFDRDYKGFFPLAVTRENRRRRGKHRHLAVADGRPHPVCATANCCRRMPGWFPARRAWTTVL